MPDSPDPPHHDPEGGFRNPWATYGKRPSGFRWLIERLREILPANPDSDEIPRAVPRLGKADEAGDPVPAASSLRATWVGHATFLLQVGGMNLLTDPHWGKRASPVSWVGPKRLAPPGIAFDALPRVDAVLLSHAHFDHLDRGTVRRLVARYGSALRWLAPLGHRELLEGWGVPRVTELDWHESVDLGPGGMQSEDGETAPAGDAAAPTIRATCLPAQHWSSRSPFSRDDRLWCSWALRGRDPAESGVGAGPGGGASVFFGGDSGWFPEYPDIGRSAGPFDLVLLPIGAYAPRWFMKPSHMDPKDAVRAYLELGGEGVFGGMHWGTFRLSDEHPLEPPEIARAAWEAAGLPDDRLWLPAMGETRVVR